MGIRSTLLKLLKARVPSHEIDASIQNPLEEDEVVFMSSIFGIGELKKSLQLSKLMKQLLPLKSCITNCQIMNPTN